jgi:hypothetical protein
MYVLEDVVILNSLGGKKIYYIKKYQIYFANS